MVIENHRQLLSRTNVPRCGMIDWLQGSVPAMLLQLNGQQSHQKHTIAACQQFA
jgi:hypothetical protein